MREEYKVKVFVERSNKTIIVLDEKAYENISEGQLIESNTLPIIFLMDLSMSVIYS